MNPNSFENGALEGDSPVGASQEVTREEFQSIVRRFSRENMGGTNIQP